ncbi:hypothetical protein [Tsukamurella sp. 1534]|uniref:hypothetical protein n=1 Tax=Tsukamurella sp. 1534 TaxID=1151061 RepID=UPI00031FE760|nr:hypothetical protein [Tsukamurella sp. 1534]
MNAPEIPAAIPEPAPPTPAAAPESTRWWSARRKLAFRFLFAFGMGVVVFSVLGNAGLGTVWYFTGVWWTLAQIGSYFTTGAGVEVTPGSIGDQQWVWDWHLGWLIVSVVITLVWTALDRRRANYRSLGGLLEVFARYGLSLSMIFYGLIKVIPTQMGFMALPSHQLQLTGDTSMFNVLWGFMGASTPYSIATGLVELAAGILLLWRRTSVAGIVLALVATAQVFLLNLFYDVPVKIVSGELFVIAVALSVPYWRNFLRVGLNRPGVEPVAPLPVWGASKSGPRILGLLVKYAGACLVVVSMGANGALMTWVQHTTRSPLDGVWRATSFTVDGAPAPLVQGGGPAPWSNIAITLRGSDSNKALETISSSYDSVVTQAPNGYVTAWQAEADGDVLKLRKNEDDAPIDMTTRLDGDVLHVSATVEGKRFEGAYERRFMERDRSHFRLVYPSPNDVSQTEDSGNAGPEPAPREGN